MIIIYYFFKFLYSFKKRILCTRGPCNWGEVLVRVIFLFYSADYFICAYFFEFVNRN